jgi:hypothetical protein
MQSTKMEKFQEKGLKNLSVLNMDEMAQVQGGDGENAPPFWWKITLSVTLDWDGWFDGSLFTHGNINEFDTP